MSPPARWRIQFHVGLAIVALVLVLVTGGTLLAITIHEADLAAERTADAMFQRTSRDAVERIDSLMNRALRAATVGAELPSLQQAGTGGESRDVAYLSGVLTADPAIYSAYVGQQDGSFVQVIGAQGDARIIAAHEAPPNTRLIFRNISATEPRTQRWRFVDGAGAVISERVEPNPTYDPRTRAWYKEAMDTAAATLSEPYIFNSLRQPGVTASRRLAGNRGVIGIDITLRELSDFLDDNPVSANGGMVLSDQAHRLLATSKPFRPDAPPLVDIRTLNVPPFPLLTRGTDTGGASAKSMVHRDVWAYGSRAINITVFAPLADFTGHIQTMQMRTLAGAGLLALVMLPSVYWMARRMTRKLDALAAVADRMLGWDFEGEVPRGWIVREFDAMAESFNMLKQTFGERTRIVEESQLKLHELIRLGVALSAERDNDRLIENILLGAKVLANADGGSVYLKTADNKLKFQVIHNDSLGIKIGRGEAEATFPPVEMFDAEGCANRGNVVSHCVHERATINVDNAYDTSAFDFSGTRAFDKRNNYRSVSILTVPLIPRNGEVLGAVQLINARSPSGEPIPFALGIQRFVEALAAQAGMALHNRNLIDSQERLMDSMIQIMADAVDAKSPYTGGHCARVPELALMLVQAASATRDGPLAEFRFDTEEEWREFRIGTWLHDCGKVTTPEYVVDKATKLETIFNRIHEVRLRFEILLRDAQIRRVEALAAGEEAAVCEARFASERASLMDDFAFIAECNIGGEFMAPDKIDRMKRIAGQTWLRHFDDRLGLSHGELSTLKDVPVEALPAVENLLADKPQHIVPRLKTDGVFDPSYRFKMTIPEHLYNRGEIHNLAVSRGTLTEEERFKINEHIVQTIIMLEHMPFPDHLKRVPEYAGTHHETMIGTGYPRRLTGDQLSVPAKVMVVADIFEALTASDRPYKKPKTLSESIKILSFFEKDRHIDPHIFRLFLSSGVYRKYAERFLAPEQIDEVDVERYLAAPVPT